MADATARYAAEMAELAMLVSDDDKAHREKSAARKRAFAVRSIRHAAQGVVVALESLQKHLERLREQWPDSDCS